MPAEDGPSTVFQPDDAVILAVRPRPQLQHSYESAFIVIPLYVISKIEGHQFACIWQSDLSPFICHSHTVGGSGQHNAQKDEHTSILRDPRARTTQDHTRFKPHSHWDRRSEVKSWSN